MSDYDETREIGAKAFAEVFQDAYQQGKRNAVVHSSVLCQSMYGRAYALVELRRIPEARDTLERLLRMAPFNAQFLIEYGNLLSRMREPAKALPPLGVMLIVVAPVLVAESSATERILSD